MSQTCKPVHDWKMPKVGDTGLTCQTCGCYVDFSAMGEGMQTSILGGRSKHYGAEAGLAFDEAFSDAFHADRESGRWDTIPAEELSGEAYAARLQKRADRVRRREQ